MAPPDDVESLSLSLDPPLRKLSLIDRITTGTFLQKTSTEDGQYESPIPLVSHQEIKVFRQLITLITDNQPRNRVLDSCCDWYKKYLRNNVRAHWPLIRSGLRAVNHTSIEPSTEDFAATLSFVHEIARQISTEKNVALTDIVDTLMNAKYFRPELDEYNGDDDDRVIPNQLVFAVIGWLLLLYEARTEQRPFTLQIRNTLTASPGSTGDLKSKIYAETSQNFQYADKPFYQLLRQFGDLFPDVKPELSRNEINSFLPAAETLAVQSMCFGTIFHVTHLTIEWVDSPSLHLELDKYRRTLKLFRFPSYARLMYHKRNLHRQLLTDHAMWKLDCEKEPLMPAAAFFRELLITYRVLFGQDERSVRDFRDALPTFNQDWDCSAQDLHGTADPLLPLLCGKSASTPEALCFYAEIDAGAVRDFYDSNEDFPIMGQRLLALQQFIKDAHPKNLRALLWDRRNPRAWYDFWSNSTLVFFASLAILIAVFQLVFQVWQVFLAKEQLAQGNMP